MWGNVTTISTCILCIAGHVLKRAERGDQLSAFSDWLGSEGVRPDTVCVGECDQGLGLLAQDNIKVSNPLKARSGYLPKSLNLLSILFYSHEDFYSA